MKSLSHPPGTSATSGQYCWGYLYNYDAWGNLLAEAGWSPNYDGCSEGTMAVSADGNNHISSFGYDASGNAQSEGSISYSWNAESEMKAAAGVTYGYDGDGRRVYESSGKLYWYGAGGDILAETDASGNTLAEYVFFGGKRLAMLPAGGNPIYYVEDMLGSSRVITQNNGAVCYDADFDPFGGEHAYSNSCPQNYKFEGKERDGETGNDDFGARTYSNRFGRWLSADWSAVPVAVPYANLSNPQTLNLYAMVADDPESFADLDGHTFTQTYQLANTGGSFWDPGSADGMSDQSGLTQEEFNLMQAAQPASQPAQNQPQEQNTTQTQNNQQPTSGINPNYKLPTGDILLKKASDFSAGAGDVLSLGTTYLARKYIFHSDSVVDKGSSAYVAGAVTGAAIGVALGKEMGPQGKIFGTRFGGNQPLLNSGETLRVGWSYIRSSGQYVFRIGGTAVGLIKDNPHINLWPPSWWLK